MLCKGLFTKQKGPNEMIPSYYVVYTCRDEHQIGETSGNWIRQTYTSPQTDGGTLTAVTGTRPKKIA